MIDPIFEIIGLLAAFLTTSAFIPQVYKIYKEKMQMVFHSLCILYYLLVFYCGLIWNFDRECFNNYCKWNYCTFTVSIIIFKLKN